jgi:toxin FitB
VKVILDTCVIAELRRFEGSTAVKAAVDRLSDEDLFLSVLTVGEIAKGIALLPPGKKKNSLTAWHTGLQKEFSQRILPVDIETAQIWGELIASAQKSGIVIPALDGMLAASALRHGMQIMTRNTKHFAASGALVIDPWI